MKKIVLLLFLAASGTCIGQVNLNLGLRAYYPFSGNASDISGNNNNAVFNNAALTADRFGNPASAYHFNGANTYIRVPNSPSLNPGNKLSLCAWVRPTGFYAGNCHGNSVIMKGNTGATPGRYLMWYDDNAGTNGINCTGAPVNPNVQNFYGEAAFTPPPGYTPYIQTGQWYSVVITYDGTTARLYINCQLKYNGPQGSLTFGNSDDLFIGALNNVSFPYWVNGDIDEVRIYDRALTSDEVNVLGDCSLINATSISGIINTYTPVLALNPCDNKLTVEDGSTFNTGDTVLMIQMKGAVIDSTNTASFGNITDYKNAGNYEFNYVKSRAGNVIELKNQLLRQYDIPVGRVQLVRVPYYNSVTITDTLTCLPWDGVKGGVLVLNVQDTVTLNKDINVSGKGFRGGVALNSHINNYQGFCGTQTYFSASTATAKQEKGEGIAEVSTQKMSGRGPLANGGGGGNMINTGGGGGSNASVGGKGGDQYQECVATPNNVGGLPGKALAYSAATNKIFMGGGGGAGDANDPGSPYNPDGGNGGAIAIIKAGYLKSNGFSIITNGNDGKTCTSNCEEGMGGGGAGGTVLLAVNNYLSATTSIISKGGKGNTSIPHNGVFSHGPGGGGGGGVIFFSNPSVPPSITTTLTGGQNGFSQTAPPVAWGAQPGNTGQTVFNLQLPFTTVAFAPNIDSVRINESNLSCTMFDFKGLAFINGTPIVSWEWFFGDGGTANTQNTSHTYSTAGTFNVKLVVTDANGCKDSITKPVNSGLFVFQAPPNKSKCGNNSVQLDGNNGNNVTYLWTPATYLSDPTIMNPIADPPVTTVYSVTMTSNACGNDSTFNVVVTVSSVLNVDAGKANDIDCSNRNAQLFASGGTNYTWTPSTGLNNPNIPNPIATVRTTQTYYVYVDNGLGCSGIDSVTVYVNTAASLARYMPNAFTPNGDGLNDCYGLKNWMYIRKLEFRIFNRYGEQVFGTSDPSRCWDGRYKGKIADQGTYVYYIKAETSCGTEEQKGNFLLLR